MTSPAAAATQTAATPATSEATARFWDELHAAVGRAVVGMVVAEMFTAMSGLGGAIVYYSNAFATDKLFVVIILLALLGVGLTETVKLLEVKMAPWKQTERAN